MSANTEEGARRLCFVCDIKLNSEAELAIHEFSKKHCDNLVRISKNKPIKPKSQKPVENPNKNTAEPVNVATEPGQFSLYGYFKTGEEGEPKTEYAPKEYNYDYDPYLQKLADNPYKALEKAAAAAAATDEPAIPLSNVTSFSSSKKKKKRSCQVCNVSNMNVPQYDAHMKSALHALTLKQTGMGVSAHFVKAGADLHTTEDPPEGGGGTASLTSIDAQIPIAPSELFCDTCDMLLNSPSQYESHMAGKSHNDKAKLKESIVAKKEKNENPSPNTLYCYSCKLMLNNIGQYNDHKNGKKHKLKCRILVNNGYTIPPEERSQGMPWAQPIYNLPIRYPELYEKQIGSLSSSDEKSVATTAENTNGVPNSESTDSDSKIATDDNVAVKKEKMEADHKIGIKKENTELQSYISCSHCKCGYNEQEPFEAHLNSEEHALKIAALRTEGMKIDDILMVLINDRKAILPDRYGRYICGICSVTSSNETENEQHLKSVLHKLAEEDYKKKRQAEIKRNVSPASDGSYKCTICKLSWMKLSEYNAHLHLQQHKGLCFSEYVKIHGYPRGHHAEERNPGVRTKVCGVATDLASGQVEDIPNMEQLEPRIDPSKNINIGLSSVEWEPPRKKKFISSFPRAHYGEGYGRPLRPPPPRGWPMHPPAFNTYGPRQNYPMRPRMPPPSRPPAWW